MSLSYCPFCGEPTGTFTIDGIRFCVVCRYRKDRPS